MEVDRNGLEVLARKDCFDLLATVPVGRIGVSMGALPVVLPVNFVLDRPNERILIRTSEGAKLRAALSHAVVAFEADHIDAMGHAGWSVLVQGRATVLEDPADLDLASRVPLRPWANEASDRWVAVSADIVSGRRVRGWYQLDPHHHPVHHEKATTIY